MTPEPKQDIMTARKLARYIADNYTELHGDTEKAIETIKQWEQSIRAECAEEVRELVETLKQCRNDYWSAYNTCFIAQAGLGIGDAKIMELKAKLPQIKSMIEQIDFALDKFDKPKGDA